MNDSQIQRTMMVCITSKWLNLLRKQLVLLPLFAQGLIEDMASILIMSINIFEFWVERIYVETLYHFPKWIREENEKGLTWKCEASWSLSYLFELVFLLPPLWVCFGRGWYQIIVLCSSVETWILLWNVLLLLSLFLKYTSLKICFLIPFNVTKIFVLVIGHAMIEISCYFFVSHCDWDCHNRPFLNIVNAC